MEVRGASFSVANAMFCPRMLLTITVMGDCPVAFMMTVVGDIGERFGARWIRSVFRGCGLRVARVVNVLVVGGKAGEDWRWGLGTCWS